MPNQQTSNPITSGRKSMWALFGVLFKLGAFTFGAGYTIVPLMQREFVDQRGWINADEMVDIIAVSQSVPGAIALNASLFIGYRINGVRGALVAVLGIALPSLIMLSVIAFFYTLFISNRIVGAVLKGINAAVVALMIQAAVKLYKPSVKDIYGAALAIIAFLLSILVDIHIVLLIIGGGFIGLAMMLLRRWRNRV